MLSLGPPAPRAAVRTSARAPSLQVPGRRPSRLCWDSSPPPAHRHLAQLPSAGPLPISRDSAFLLHVCTLPPRAGDQAAGSSRECAPTWSGQVFSWQVAPASPTDWAKPSNVCNSVSYPGKLEWPQASPGPLVVTATPQPFRRPFCSMDTGSVSYLYMSHSHI